MPTGRSGGEACPPEQLRRRAERIRREEFAEAVAALEARGDLTRGQRDAIEEMTVAIVGRVLAAPETALAETTDGATVRSVTALFDLDGE